MPHLTRYELNDAELTRARMQRSARRGGDSPNLAPAVKIGVKLLQELFDAYDARLRDTGCYRQGGERK